MEASGDTQVALQATQSTTYTKAEVDKSLVVKANQSTTYTKIEVDTALALKANQSTTHSITQVDNLLAQKQPFITSSTNLTIGRLTTQTHVITPVLRATHIESSHVANSGNYSITHQVWSIRYNDV